MQSSTTCSVREPGKTERGREGERGRGGGAGKSDSARDGENIRGLKNLKKKKQCSQFTPRGGEQGEVILMKINN